MRVRGRYGRFFVRARCGEFVEAAGGRQFSRSALKRSTPAFGSAVRVCDPVFYGTRETRALLDFGLRWRWAGAAGAYARCTHLRIEIWGSRRTIGVRTSQFGCTI